MPLSVIKPWRRACTVVKIALGALSVEHERTELFSQVGNQKAPAAKVIRLLHDTRSLLASHRTLTSIANKRMGTGARRTAKHLARIRISTFSS
jgi:hypothetical protein